MRYFFKKYWIILIIAAQPLLDILAYWRADSVATEAGYIRLALMLVLPFVLLIKQKNKLRFLAPFFVMGVFCLFHFLNSYRVGYIDPVFDISYLARVIQMPVLTVCFIYYIKDDMMRDSAVKGLIISAAITVSALVLACLTGTQNVTYGEGLGVSGWVIDSNRCANSIILVTLSVFAVLPAAYSRKRLINITIPLIVAAVFLTNGTKACFYSVFAVLGGYACFIIVNKLINKDTVRTAFLITLVAVMLTSIVIYPYTPRYKVTAMQQQAASKDQSELERKITALGYDPKTLTKEDKMNIPEVREVIEDYYYRAIIGVIPDMIDRFGMDRILDKYDATITASTIISTRIMKLKYACLVWDDCDFMTKLFGFEVTQMGTDGLRDVENDWPALFYYYGFVGFTLYSAFILYFIILTLRRVLKTGQKSLNVFNFSLILCLGLQLGLAQFSGALLRRPNASVYLSVVLALIYYQTVRAADTDKGVFFYEA